MQERRRSRDTGCLGNASQSLLKLPGNGCASSLIWETPAPSTASPWTHWCTEPLAESLPRGRVEWRRWQRWAIIDAQQLFHVSYLVRLAMLTVLFVHSRSSLFFAQQDPELLPRPIES